MCSKTKIVLMLCGLAMIPDARQSSAKEAISPSLPALVEVAPDGRDLIPAFRNAEYVDDVLAAVDMVKGQLSKAREVQSALDRLHREIIRCEPTISMDAANSQHIEKIGLRLRSFANVLADINAEMKKSIESMRQKVRSEKPSTLAFKTKGDITQFEGAAVEFGKLFVEAQEMAKTLDTLAVDLPTTLASCQKVKNAPSRRPHRWSRHELPPPRSNCRDRN
jgi:hypothetical protein